jgi:hypothetical protein
MSSRVSVKVLKSGREKERTVSTVERWVGGEREWNRNDREGFFYGIGG